MWCRKNGNRSNVTKRVRKRYSHLNHMQIWVSEKQTENCRAWTVFTVCRVCMVCSLKTVLSTIFHERQNEGLFFCSANVLKSTLEFLSTTTGNYNIESFDFVISCKVQPSCQRKWSPKLFSRILSRLFPCYLEIKSISTRALKT